MEPIEWIIAGGMAIAALVLNGCSDEKSVRHDDDTDDAWFSDLGEIHLPEADVEVADEYVSCEDAGRAGFNTKLSRLGCKIADVDVKGGKIFGVCSTPIPDDDYLNFFSADISNFKLGSGFKQVPLFGKKFITTKVGEKISYDMSPSQAILSAGMYIVPFNGKADENNCVSGIAFLSSDGSLESLHYFNSFSYGTTQSPTTPCNVKTAILETDMSNNPVGLWTSFDTGEKSMIRRYGISQSVNTGMIDFDAQSGSPYILDGKNPSAMAAWSNPTLGRKYIAVLNPNGYGSSKPPCSDAIFGSGIGCSNANIEVYDVTNGETQADPKALIDLGVESVPSLHELPITESGHFAALVANGSLVIIDLIKFSIASTFQDDRLTQGNIGGIAVKNGKTYISVGDSIIIYDISDAVHPRFDRAIHVKSGLGDLDVDDDGIIYVAVPFDFGSPSYGRDEIWSIDPDVASDNYTPPDGCSNEDIDG